MTFIKSYLKVPDDEAEKSYDFLIKEMPQDLIPEDAVIRAGIDFATERSQTVTGSGSRYLQSPRLVIRGGRAVGRIFWRMENSVAGRSKDLNIPGAEGDEQASASVR